MILTSFILMHFLIGIYDFSFYRIPNLFLGILMGLYGIYAPLYLDQNTILSSLALFAVILFLCFGLYGLKLIDAGDAKYIAISSLWFGIHGILPLLLLISLVGGGQAMIYLMFRDHVNRLSDWSWLKIQKAEALYPALQNIWVGSGIGPERGKRKQISSSMTPYGIAIASGSIIMLMIKPMVY